MRVFSKKTYQFDHPAGTEPAVIVQMQSFADVPDWVSESTMYTLASATGDVEQIGSKQDEKATETGLKDRTKAEKQAETKAKADEEKRLKAEEEEKARLLAEQQQ